MAIDRQAYAIQERELGRRTYFPNTGNVAYFDPQSQTIQLSRITLEAFAAAIAARDLATSRSHLATMLHEITHWADLVGTLWGRLYLREVYAALRILERLDDPGVESEYHQFIALHDRTRRLMLSRYFRTVHPTPAPHDHRHPWRWQLSAGREFDPWGRPDDTRPVLFIRFDDHAGGERIARQPISVGALLEVNAVWSELRTSSEVIGMMEPMLRTVEQRMVGQELLGQLYDPAFTLYTAPAHLVANVVRTTDVARAYALGSALAHVVLNLDDADFQRLAMPAVMEPWKALVPGFIAAGDRGFAFAAICMSGAEHTGGRPVGDWVDEALARAGLDPAPQVLARAARTMAAEAAPEPGDMLGRAHAYLLRVGCDVLKARSGPDPALTPTVLQVQGLPAPPMFDPNGELVDLMPGRFDTAEFPPEELYFAAARLHTWTTNFLEACR
jgi:hypothetical protein